MALSAGTRLGRYEVVSLLGVGGMGEVYRARDTRLDRQVAIKVLPAAIADSPDALARFEREARAVAALSWLAAVMAHRAQVAQSRAVRPAREREIRASAIAIRRVSCVAMALAVCWTVRPSTPSGPWTTCIGKKIAHRCQPNRSVGSAPAAAAAVTAMFTPRSDSSRRA